MAHVAKAHTTQSLGMVVKRNDGTLEDHGIVSGGGWRGRLSRLRVRLLGPVASKSRYRAEVKKQRERVAGLLAASEDVHVALTATDPDVERALDMLDAAISGRVPEAKE